MTRFDWSKTPMARVFFPAFLALAHFCVHFIFLASAFVNELIRFHRVCMYVDLKSFDCIWLFEFN
jgi:hypothetical protein